MALSAGTRLGPYEILGPLGAGGMGEVYRARDTRLDRTVAVKVLPEGLAGNPQLRARFEREARAISALAHPNICTLHDVGEQNGQTFLVMEHLVGQTLAERLKKGPLPIDQALKIGIQIADGLSAAHRQGIVHRDLKPSNVMLTKTGARLLDFGLARLTAQGEQPAVSAASSVPTEPEPLTGAGTVMGTLPYMAPEQVEGLPADARTDVWALGTILYEMITGHRAFEAATSTSLVGAILEREPQPLAQLQPLTPLSVERLVRRCLAKEPDERWDTVHDLGVNLREIAEVEREVETRVRARSLPRWVIPALAGVAVVAMLVGVVVERSFLGPAPILREGPVVRSEIELTADRPLAASGGGSHPSRRELALSGDGTLLVWTNHRQEDGARPALNFRRLETGEIGRLPETEGGTQPFLSPDGRWVAFSVREGPGQYSLRKVPVEGGLTVNLARLPWRLKGASWGEDGSILLGSVNGGIFSIPEGGGEPREITAVDLVREADHQLPCFLPGDRVFLFTAMLHPYDVRSRIEAFSLATRERMVVVEDGADARYLRSGHLVFMRRGVLMAAPFDVEELQLTASPLPVLDGVSQALQSGASAAGQFVVSDSGLLIYASGSLPQERATELLLADRSGRFESLAGFDKPLVSAQMHFSPSGRQLAFVEKAASGLLWLFDAQRHTFQVLSNGGLAASPRWSPDGSQLAVAWSETGPFHLWLVSGGKSDWQQLTDDDSNDWAPSWSPDGRFIAFVRGDWARRMDIFLYRLEDRKASPFIATPASESHPDISPDGRWLAYVSDVSGRPEVYVTSLPVRGTTLTVSSSGGRAPAWSRDGATLYYYSPESESGQRFMMAVTARSGPELKLGPPTPLFELPDGVADFGPMRNYALHSDGRHFLIGRMLAREAPPPITRLNLVHNWFTELERLSPTR